MNDPQAILISALIMVTLVLVLSASVTMFWVLCQRATTDRHIVALAEWAREKGFCLRPQDDVPPLLARMPGPDGGAPLVRLCVGNNKTLLVQFQTAPPARPTGGIDLPFSNPTLFPAGRNDHWQAIVRQGEFDWKPTGLRPGGATASLLDLFALTSFPRLGDPERLVVCGTDSEAARALSQSFVVALLPPDVGLLLHGKQIALDFSNRPFDVIEFNRMLTLMDQIAEHLPESVQ